MSNRFTEDNYVGRRLRGGRKRRRFLLEWWNVYERTVNGDPRTNNHAEAGHHKLQNEFDFSHPSIWKFVQTLKKFQKIRDVEYSEGERGVTPPV